MDARNKKVTRKSWDAVIRVFVRLMTSEDNGDKAPLTNMKFEDSEEELTGSRATACCNPRRNFHRDRCFVLALICFLNFGK